MPAAIDGIAAADNQVLALEAVQQPDQLRGVDAHPVGERLLAHRPLTQLIEQVTSSGEEVFAGWSTGPVAGPRAGGSSSSAGSNSSLATDLRRSSSGVGCPDCG